MVQEAKKKTGIESKVFFPPLIVAVLMIAAIRYDLEAANAAVNAALKFVTHQFGWAFEWYIVVTFVIWLWLIFGPWANKKFGNEAPEFSTPSWIFLLFASSTSAAVIFWGSIEVYYYATTLPFGYEPTSRQAIETSLAYAMFHWGLIS